MRFLFGMIERLCLAIFLLGLTYFIIEGKQESTAKIIVVMVVFMLSSGE